MKKTLWLTLTAVIAAGGIFWLGRSIWRAKTDTVSLHVRNAPVAAVLRQLESQSGETIVAGKDLTGSVTLDLDSLPLTEALDHVAAQAGGMAGAIHAVYRSDYELRQLKAELAAGRSPAEPTWTNLAPHFDLPVPGNDDVAADLPPGENGQPRVKVVGSGALSPEIQQAIAAAMQGTNMGGRGKVTISAKVNGRDLPPGELARVLREQLGTNSPLNAEASSGTITAPEGGRQMRVMALTLDNGQVQHGDVERMVRAQLGTNAPQIASAVAEAVTGALRQEASGKGTRNVQVHSHSGAPVMVMRRVGPGGADEAQTDIWAPERIIMENSLSPRLGTNLPASPSRAEAEAVARKVEGRCVTLYALQASPAGGMGPDFLRAFRREGGGSRPARVHLGADGKPDLNAITSEVENRLQRESLERFQNLTPEQRAERARAAHNTSTNR